MTAAEKSIRENSGLILVGTVGAGKTTIMRAIEGALAMQHSPTRLHDRHHWLNEPNWWTTADEFCEDVKRGWAYAKSFSDWSDAYSADGIAGSVQRLFLDDLGVERPTEANLDAIIALLSQRHRSRLPTWITMNLSVAEFTSRYGERIASRLGELCSFAEIDGGDRRSTLGNVP
jgi:DNA replication protein DnaC